MEITFDFATRDDCLDQIVPSDLRKLVAERDGFRVEAEQWREAYSRFDSDEQLMIQRDEARAQVERLRALVSLAFCPTVGDWYGKAKSALDETPVQCLAEHDAALFDHYVDRRIEYFALQHNRGYALEHCPLSLRDLAFESARIRKEAK